MVIPADHAVLAHGANILKHPYRIYQFYYPLDDLRDEVYKRTSMIGKFRTNREGASLFDLFALSSDEATTFDTLLRQAADDVAQVLQPFMGVGECYIFNRDAIAASPGLPVSVNEGDYVRDPDGRLFRALRTTDTTHTADTEAFRELPVDVTRSVHYVVKRPLNTLPNMLAPVDAAIREALVLFIVWQWLLLVEQGDGKAQLYGTMWHEARTNVAYKMNLSGRKTTPGHPF